MSAEIFSRYTFYETVMCKTHAWIYENGAKGLDP